MTQEPKLSQTVARAFDVMQAKLAAREKRMREVAAKVDSIADEMLAVSAKRTPRVLSSFAYDLKAEAAKLLEGLGAE